MSIDFCDVKLGTFAEVGSGIKYEIPNPDNVWSGLERGSMIHSYAPCNTKDIEFRFEVPIDIRAIAFSISTDSLNYNFHRQMGVKVLTWHLSTDSPSFPNKIFRLQSSPKASIIIINNGYQVSDEMRRRGFYMDPCYPINRAHRLEISTDHHPDCLNVDRLRIKLSHLSGSFRVIFDKIIILGQPSTFAFTSDMYKNLTERILNHKPEIPKTPVKKSPRNVSSTLLGSPNTSRGLRMVAASRRRDEYNIPPEFRDPFTNELMEFPMCLPCGKSCDKLYLHKYLRLEKKWARKQNDPFTGKPFTRDELPTPNHDLKVKIDKWCLMSMLGKIPDWYTA